MWTDISEQHKYNRKNRDIDLSEESLPNHADVAKIVEIAIAKFFSQYCTCIKPFRKF